MITFLCLLSEIMLISLVCCTGFSSKRGAVFWGIFFLTIILFKMAAQLILSLSLEQ